MHYKNKYFLNQIILLLLNIKTYKNLNDLFYFFKFIRVI